MSTIATRCADNIRILAAAMVEKANSGHPGGPMGGADFINILYSEFLRFDPDDMSWSHRDRFYLDPGHMSAMLYAQLHLCGTYTKAELEAFRQWGSPTPGHPEVDFVRGIENTSGPLGLGHAFGAGSAIAEAFLRSRFGNWMEHYTYLYISDGGIQEEISQGVGRIAGHLGLGKIIMFYDANDVQLSTMVDEVTNEDTEAKYQSWNWHVITIEGNDPDAIRKAIKAGQEETEKPTLIIGKTIMGKGAVTEDGTSYEGEVETHGKPLGKSKASFENTVTHLGGNPENPFKVFKDVQEYYSEVLNSKRKAVAEHKNIEAQWRSENEALAEKLDNFLTGQLPNIDWESIPTKENDATRNASSAVLGHLAEHVENMIVSSADLSNSDKTEGFLKKSSVLKKGDFSGGFLQAGVSELTMAALCTGIALHGGVIPVCATFFAFSDYMKPVLRVAALMETPVKFIWTHDAFRVGEDGPTHQPIEQEMQLRLLEKVKNHSGNPSFLALRPADGPETVVTWKMMLECDDRPSGLILSRQNIQQVPSEGNDTRWQIAQQASLGGYIALDCDGQPDVLLIANGSEVSTCAGAISILKDKGIKARLVSIPSEGLLKSQSKEYINILMESNIKKYGLTAGLPENLESLVGHNGMVHGIDHFGYSAPFNVLDEKFGFTSEQVADQIINFLNE